MIKWFSCFLLDTVVYHGKKVKRAQIGLVHVAIVAMQSKVSSIYNIATNI
jgi:hypothetical protein